MELPEHPLINLGMAVELSLWRVPDEPRGPFSGTVSTTHAVASLFESHRTADLVVEHLVQEYGVPREHVRVYARDTSGAGEARSPQDSDQEASLSDRLPRRRFASMPREWGRAAFWWRRS